MTLDWSVPQEFVGAKGLGVPCGPDPGHMQGASKRVQKGHDTEELRKVSWKCLRSEEGAVSDHLEQRCIHPYQEKKTYGIITNQGLC